MNEQDRPDWWTPEHEQAALGGVQDGIRARRTPVDADIDRRRVAEQFNEALTDGVALKVALSLGEWAGRGADPPQEVTGQAGYRALDDLDQLIARLTEYRGQLATALPGADGEIRHVELRRRPDAPDADTVVGQLMADAVKYGVFRGNGELLSGRYPTSAEALAQAAPGQIVAAVCPHTAEPRRPASVCPSCRADFPSVARTTRIKPDDTPVNLTVKLRDDS